MPVPPSVWQGSAPASAQQFNQDLYSYDGSGYGSNGINWHANRPVLYTAAWQTRGLSANTVGLSNNIAGSGTNAFNILDTAALFGLGSAGPGQYAGYTFVASATSGAGTPGLNGGYYISCNFTAMHPAASGPACVGGELYLQIGTAAATFYELGNIQRAYTSYPNTPMFMDIINTGAGTAGWSPGVLAADASAGTAFTYANTTGSQGQTVRQFWIWESVTGGGSTVAALPAPGTAYTAASTITSSGLNSNNGIQGTFNFLNNPPLVKCQQFAGTSIPATTITTIPFSGGALYDNYSGFNAFNHEYTVPITGLYLCHGVVVFNDGTGAVASRSCGFTINGTSRIGPAYASVNTGANTGCTVTRIYDLQAGDTVKLYAYQTDVNPITLSTSNTTRFFMCWLAGTGNSNLTWTPPDTSFRWQAGTPGSQMPALFNTHMANDLNFLVYRPYFTGYQTTAQTGLGNNTGYHIMTGWTVGGIVHGTNGDPYNGWSSANNNWVAPVNGWYLAVGEFLVNDSATTTGYVTAGIYVPFSGGYTPPHANSYPPDSYQQIFNNLSGSGGPFGATCAGLYYLLAGETIQAQVQAINWGTWSTAVASGVNSHFSVVWICN